MNGTINTAAAAAATTTTTTTTTTTATTGVPTRQRRRRIKNNSNNGCDNILNVPLASPTSQRQRQNDDDDHDDDHDHHEEDQKQQHHHKRRFMMIPSSLLPLIVRRSRRKQQRGQQQRQRRRRRRIRKYPPGSYDARIQQHREIIFFCVIFTILGLILLHLISILLYMNASSLESLIRGIDINFNDNGPILIIGGTDGSGTRAFVDTLKELGCVIVYDDPITFDIHASELFKKRGWPAFVTEVLHQTHSANYNFDVDLPTDTQDVLIKEMNKFQHSLEPKYHYAKNLHKEHIQKQHRNEIFNRLFNFQKGSQQHNNNNNNNNEHHHLASKISFVMKAPVSMLVLPVLTKLFDRKIKFLHVVRDGRDIALSDNQSPVVKFYDTMYENDDDHQTQQQLENFKTKPDNILNIRAIQLWNDWNIQVQQFLKSNSASNNIEYLTIRSEDLLQKETRYDALLALKEFVGSHLSQQELCCIAYEQTKDYGHSSVHTEKNGRPDMSMPDEPKDLLKPFLGRQKRNVNPSSEMMKRLNTHGNELNRPQQQHLYPRRKLKQMVMDEEEEAVDNKEGGMEETKQSFMKDLKEYKQVVLHQGKAMSMEQLEEWIDRGEQLKLSLQEIQSPSYAFEDVNDHYTLELQDYVDTLQTYYKRKENLEELRNENLYGGPKIPRPIIPIEQPLRQQQNLKIKNVKKRYGKWQQILANQPQLLEILQQEGKEALEYFGYEPYRTITYYNNRTHHNDQQQQQPFFGHDADTTASSENSGGTNTLKEQEEGSFVCTREVALDICGRYD